MKKGASTAPQFPESPFGSPSTSRKPLWLPTLLQLLFSELLMFLTFKYLNFLKFLTLWVQLKQACC